MASRNPPPLVVEGRTIRVTNLDKVMYPTTGTTKGEVIDYYRAVAPWFVPHAAGRPATRKRWVEGVGTADAPRDGFFHKNLDPRSTPEWVRRRTIEHKGDDATYPLVDDAATLCWLGQLAALELHVPQWRFSDAGVRQHPDRLVLDLDPGEGAGMPECVELALLIREVLDDVGLVSVPVTSGSKGIHLYAGLDGSLTSAAASALARELARSLEAAHPNLVVSDMKKAIRTGKVLLDWSQNNGNKTTIAPYSLRGRLRPTVAVPRAWDELRPDLPQLEFPEVLERLATLGDPLAVLLPTEAAASEVALPVPETLEPMLATLGSEADVSGPGWHYEVKWDGYRALASVSGGAVAWRSRNGVDLAGTYPELDEVAALLGDHEAVLDGEIVALDAAGRSRFELLQNHGRGAAPAHYMVFDLLRLDGRSLLRTPYVERRAALKELLPGDGRYVHVPETFGSDRELALEASHTFDLEGVVAKRADSVYQPGRRARTWIKVKNQRTQEVVVVGWRPGEGGRGGTLGSLLLAVPDAEGRLTYAGRAGSGFTDRALREARGRLDALARDTPPIDGVPRPDARDARWVEPTLVGEVTFAEWTGSGRLRHPVWRGWRPDKEPADVVVERGRDSR